MDQVDQKLLEILQYDFPLTVDPWKDIAEKIGLSEEEVLKRIKKLKEEGVIRRIGGVIDGKKIGYKSTLIAVMVDEENLQKVVDYLNSLIAVTHNYLRDGEWNLWCTFNYLEDDELKSLEEKLFSLGIKDMMILPAERVVRIDARFK